MVSAKPDHAAFDTKSKAARSDKLKIFISYSRRDAAAADAIVAALTERGFEVKIDTRDLPFGEEWQKELAEFIRLSDTVIWLVSEASIKSEWVNWELDEVKARNKRLVPVMVGLVNPAELPRQLGAIHILPPDRVFDLARDLDTLAQVLETDHAWLKQATRWQDRAAEWLAKGRTSALLLSRGALTEAERWKETRPAKAPAPAPEVLDLLLASRQAANRRLRFWALGGLITAAGASALAAFAFLQSAEVARQRDEASKLARSSQLFSAALQQENHDPTLGLRLMQEAQAVFPTKTTATTYDQWYRTKQFYKMTLPHERAGSLVFLPDGKGLASASEESVKLWTTDGTLKHKVKGSLPIAISPDGKDLVTLTERYGGTFQIIDPETGNARPLELDARHNTVMVARFSADGRRLAVGLSSGDVLILDRDSGRVQSFAAHSNGSSGHRGTTSLDFSRDGRFLATGGDDKLVRIWDMDAKHIRDLAGHTAYVEDVAFSADSKVILSRGMDQTTRLWSVAGDRLGQVRSHATYGKIARFTALGETYFSTLEPDRLVLWDREGRVLQQLTARGEITAIDLSSDGALLATLHRPSDDGSRVDPGGIRLWRLSRLRAVMEPKDGSCTSTIDVSATARIVAVGPKDNCVSRQGMRNLVGYSDTSIRIVDTRAGTAREIDSGQRAGSVKVSRDGRLIGLCGATATLMDGDGKVVRAFEAAACPMALAPNGELAVISRETGIFLWSRTSDALTKLGEPVDTVRFSPRGDSVLSISRRGQLEHRGIDGRPIPVPDLGAEVTAIGFSTDGSNVLAFDGVVRLWPIGEPSKARVIEIAEPRLHALLHLPERNVVVTANFERLAFWGLDGSLVGSETSVDAAILSLTAGPDGTSVLASTSLKTIMDVAVPKPLPEFERSSELAQMAPIDYALAGIDHAFRRLLEIEDPMTSKVTFLHFAHGAWGSGEPQLLRNAMTFAERIAERHGDAFAFGEILNLANALELTAKFNATVRALKPEQLTEVSAFAKRQAQSGSGASTRRSKGYEEVAKKLDAHVSSHIGKPQPR